MIITKFPRYLRGYVTFEIKGEKIEEFLNLCAQKKIDLFQIKVEKERATIRCLVSAYKQVQKIRVSGLKRRIIKKHGARFIAHRYRKRIGLVAGAGMMIVLLIFLSGFVWNIDVTGNDRLSANVILQTLQECGFYEGERKNKLDISEIENQMMMKLPDLSWITINLDGSFAHVEVKERQMPPVLEDVSRPSNLVASMDGQIVKMEIMKGKPIATVGSGVVKGQLLVAGLYNDRKENIILEHSSGKVIAQVELKKTFELPFESERTVGNEEKLFYSLQIFGKTIDFSFGKRPQETDWDKTEERKRVSLFGLDFPIYTTESKYSRKISEKIMLSNKEAKNKVKMEIEHFEKSELYGAEIVEKHVTWASDEKTCRAKVEYIILTNIASQQYIETDEQKK